MGRLGVIVFLAIGFLSTSAYGYEFPSAKNIVSKIIDTATGFVGKQKQNDLFFDIPENAHPVEFAAVPFVCHEDGLFSYPKDCTLGVRCKGGMASIFTCTDIFHFNNNTKKCEDFCSAHCDEYLACYCGWDTCQTSTEIPSTEYSESAKYKLASTVPKAGFVGKQKQNDLLFDIPENAHPVEFAPVPFVCHEDGLFSYPKDCTLGVRCTGGMASVFTCTDIFHFNNYTKKCENFCSAHCDEFLACICGWDTCQKSTEMPRIEDSESDESAEDTLNTYTCRHNGFFADPRRCNRYIHCLDGRAVFRRCPSGLHFNKKTKRCDVPCSAKCDPTISCKWKSSQTAETPVTEDVTTLDSMKSAKKIFTLKLKFVCVDDGLFPNPRDCNKYVSCSNGISYDMWCPYGLHFSNETQRCESPCSAKCDPTLPCKWRTFKETVIPKSKDCPRDGIYAVAYPSDCESYISCENGSGLLFQCDEGDHFNPVTLDCEEPCEARCDSSMAEECGWEETSESKNVLANSLRQPIFDFSCDGNGLYENPHACENFIQCTGGHAYLIDCPSGQHYNSVTQSCTTPCEARCDLNYQHFCKDEETDQPRKHLLKDFDCDTDGYHANPIDCNSFIQCFRGSSYAIYCPMNLHYSRTMEICTTPCEAKCAPNYEDYCRQDEWNRRRPPPPRSNSVKQPFPLVSEFLCTKDGLYPNPEECNSYMECVMGEAIVRPCPEGFHFSEKTQRCESPCDARCDSSIGSSCGWDESWASTKSLQDSTLDYEMFFSHNSPSLMYHFTCLKDGLYKTPENCSTFIQCAGGHSYVMECPEGLHFNEESRVCDYPCHARCNATFACECGWDTCNEDEERYFSSSSDEVDCEARPEVGTCRDVIARYYYDAQSGRCRGFRYSGCGGNSNNFKTVEECRSKCKRRLLRGFRCPANTGFFGHFPDCTSYYHCKRGIPTLKRCPKGTAFHHKKSKCVAEYEATCVYECRDKDAVYPYEVDCRKYIDCVNGVSKLETCPRGKAFDPDERDCIDERQVSTCMWPSQVEN